ncbi:hypothetical protein EV361DRAFT_872194 [Lentinula raphanica]|nr:hypothetical protein EV361DRAFT_872194 [Lentinula raphanica]
MTENDSITARPALDDSGDSTRPPPNQPRANSSKNKLREKIMNGLREAAKAEATSSFRPKHSSSSTSNRKQTNARSQCQHSHSKSARKASKSDNQSMKTTVTFATIALAPLEVIQDTEFGYATFSDGEDQTISNSDLIKWENMGLATTNIEDGFKINIREDHKDFIDFVYTLFPKAAKYIKASRPIPNPEFRPGIDKDFKKTLSPIVACMKEDRKYMVIPSMKANWITGEIVAASCVARGKRGWHENILVLCSRIQFPPAVLLQWCRGESPLPDVRSLSSDDEELNAGLELLKTKAKGKGKRRAHRVRSPSLTLTDPSLPNLGNSGERHSPTPSPPPPPRRSMRRSLFILDSDSEHDEKKSPGESDLEDTFPGLERAIANSRTDKGGVQCPSSLNAATVPSGPSNTDMLSASPWLVDKRPQWLKDSAGYFQGCNISSTLDRPRDFKF